MVDELLAGPAHLAVVCARGEVERPSQQLAVGVRFVPLDLGKQLVDEVLMSFEYCHTPSVARGFERTQTAGNRVFSAKVFRPCSAAADR